MPVYEYQCAAGHIASHIRPFSAKYAPTPHCGVCGAPMTAIAISKSHVEPDGMYSYAENLGNADQFERRLEAMKRGDKVYKKEA